MELQKTQKYNFMLQTNLKNQLTSGSINLATEPEPVETEQTNFEYIFCSRFLTPPISCRRMLMQTTYLVAGPVSQNRTSGGRPALCSPISTAAGKCSELRGEGPRVFSAPISLGDILLRGVKSRDVRFLWEVELVLPFNLTNHQEFTGDLKQLIMYRHPDRLSK